MHLRLFVIFTLAAGFGSLRADFSYEQTSKITGGAMMNMMKMVGTFSKDARAAVEPTLTTVAVKGNRMVNLTKRTAQIMDIDKETITHVDFDKKTYSITTFAQMKAMMEQMQDKMQSGSPAAPGTSGSPNISDAKISVDMKDTGQTKSFNGKEAHEMIMTTTMQGTDAKSGTKGAMDMNVDMWIAPNVPGYGEVRDFNKRMAEKMNWTPGANPMMAGRPEIARGMAELYKQSAKMDGIPIYQVIRMNGSAEGIPSGPQSTGTASAPQPSVNDAIASALGGRFGGLGGLSRKKKTQDQPKPDAAAGETQSISGSLMEMTMEVTNFSSAPVDPSKFEVPAGFAKVEDPMSRARQR